MSYTTCEHICDSPSENQPCLHLVVFRETLFWNIQLQKLTPALYCACVFSSKILSYLLVFIIANLLYLWWLNFMVFSLSLSAVSIANRGVGWDGRWGGVGGWVAGGKNPLLGYPMSSHDAHTVANDTSVGHMVSGSKPRSPLPNGCPPWVSLFQPWLWRVSKMLLRKADQLTFNTWYTGDG